VRVTADVRDPTFSVALVGRLDMVNPT